MTQPTWLIEADVAGIPSEPLQAEMRRQGMDICVVKFFPDTMPPGDIAGAEAIPRDACVAFLGAPALMRHIQMHRRWRPGGWCTFENLACRTYYTYFGAHLLNRLYALLPIAEALRQVHHLFEIYGRNEQVFLRPSPARKMFNGTLADKDEFRQVLRNPRLDPKTLVIVAQPQVVHREWRLFVANSKIITASQYGNQGRYEVIAGCPDEVQAFGLEVLQQVTWRPDPLFAMDICEAEGKVHLLELNGFSCSSFYDCDLEVIVRSASRLAAASW